MPRPRSPEVFPDALDEDFHRNVRRWLAAGRAQGLVGTVRSGFRTRAEQAAIYQRKMAAGGSSKTVGRPGHSMHERGLAVDIAMQRGDLADLAALAPQFGIVQAPWQGGPQADPVHFEPIGARAALKARKQADRGPRPAGPVAVEPPPSGPWPGHFLPRGPLPLDAPAAPPRWVLEGGAHDPLSAVFQFAHGGLPDGGR